jgi:hypothetical protein
MDKVEYELLDAKDLTSEECYSEWLKATRRELGELNKKGFNPDDWVKFVRYEVNSCLDKYFPIMKNGNVGIKYTHPISAEYEGGKEYNYDKADGVTINLVFEFEEPIDTPKEDK